MNKNIADANLYR